MGWVSPRWDYEDREGRRRTGPDGRTVDYKRVPSRSS